MTLAQPSSQGVIGESAEVRPHDDIAEAGLPVGERQGADDLVLDIPTEEHVALGESISYGGEELLGADTLAAIDTVHVAAADLDDTDVVLLDGCGYGVDVHLAVQGWLAGW